MLKGTIRQSRDLRVRPHGSFQLFTDQRNDVLEQQEPAR